LPLRLLLDPVVADRRGCVEAVVDVGLLQRFQEAGLHRVRRPDPCVAIRLQLGAHGPALRPLGVVPDLIEDAEQVLHVVPVLVCEHVRLNEGCVLRAELALQVVEEAQVDVDEVVARAVEGTDL
jgi:hypothetical protein